MSSAKVRRSLALSVLPLSSLFVLSAGSVQAQSAPPATSAAATDLVAQQTLAVVERHGRAMATKNVDVILSDYADDAIVFTNLVDKPLVGKAAIRKLVEDVLKWPVDPKKTGNERLVRHEAVGEYAFHIFESDAMSGTETYVVRDGKIICETATIRTIYKPTSLGEKSTQ